MTSGDEPVADRGVDAYIDRAVALALERSAAEAAVRAAAEESKRKAQLEAGAEESARQAEVARALYAASSSDLAMEVDRGRALDTKLVQIATFSGVAVSLIGSVGATLGAAQTEYSHGLRLAIGVFLVLSAALLLAAIAVAYVGLAPKPYRGINETAFRDRADVNRLSDHVSQAYRRFIATQAETFSQARSVNDRKGQAATNATKLVFAGMACVVASIVLRTVGSLT